MALTNERCPAVGYLSFATDGDQSGLLIRHGNSRPVPMVRVAYFAHNLSLAEKVVTLLDEGGRELLESAAMVDPQLASQWEDMSEIGFLANAPDRGLPFASLTLLVRDYNSVIEENLLLNVNLLDYSAITLSDALNACPFLELQSLRFTSDKIPVAISLPLDEVADNDLIERICAMLDSSEATYLRRLSPPLHESEADERTATQKLLEAEGFLFHYKVSLELNQLNSQTASWLTGVAQRAPSRTIQLTVDRPPFSDVREIEHFYQKLDSFYGELYRAAPQILQFSPFSRLFFHIIEPDSSLVHRYNCTADGHRIKFNPEEFPSLSKETSTDLIDVSIPFQSKPLVQLPPIPSGLFDQTLIDTFLEREQKHQEILTSLIIHEAARFFKDTCHSGEALALKIDSSGIHYSPLKDHSLKEHSA